MKSIDIKCRVTDLAIPRQTAIAIGAMFEGKESLLDTYFAVPAGYLKLRESEIDRDRLLFYRRERRTGPTPCESWEAGVDPTGPIRDLLAAAFGVRAEVRKTRETFVRQNVRIQLDRLRKNRTLLQLRYDIGPGETVDEATNELRRFMDTFDVRPENCVAESCCEMHAG